ncbi:cell wall-associated hydrolase [Alphaproteobacteria phage PhiJL001]|uniref:Cell wall-associated hydrolase n=1 Tax=Alphaproteobacteria phage PhiJL001 TaxID=2681607 RepID=Q5DN20_9CAUD|nr:minor tail protein [Alphaproteobacteria phage PhiJL001]AAT69484.1 cell wall-associated hydrolase [Alphaproteobacteria phage PhiJL001]
MVTRDDIVAEALSWEGVPWRHQGRTRKGIDCAGLAVLVGSSLGLTTANPTAYPRRPDGSFLRHFQDALEQIPVRDILPGDVVIFSGTDHSHVCHCGIVAVKYNRQSVIHAHATRRKVIHERMWEAESVVGRPVHAFRYPGVV